MGKIPSEWKVGKVIPIPKGKHLQLPSNYRPIMLLPIVSKILERHIFNILRDFMHNQCPLSPNQWGFCSGKSTSTALAYITHCWNAKLHTGVDICAVFFDLRKAFDRALLQKLSKLDLPPLLFQWLQDYLTGRFKQVAIGEAISRLLPVLLGVCLKGQYLVRCCSSFSLMIFVISHYRRIPLLHSMQMTSVIPGLFAAVRTLQLYKGTLT